MKHLFILITFLTLTGVSQKATAQKALQDSLQTVLAQAELSMHDRIMTQSRFATTYRFENLPKAVSLNTTAIHFAKSTKDKDALTFVWTKQALLTFLAKDSLASQKAIDSALYFAPSASPVTRGYAQYIKGFLQLHHHSPEKAVKTWQKALLFLQEPKGIEYQAHIYYLLYGIYAERGDSSQATKYARLAQQRAQQSNDPGLKVATWQIVGTNYLDRYGSSKDTQLLDSAIVAYQRSIKIYKANKDRIVDHSIITLSALGLANYYIDNDLANHKSDIIGYIHLAMAAVTKVDVPVMEIDCYQMLSKFKFYSGDKKAAKTALLKAKQIADSIQPPNYISLKNLFQSLAFVDEQMGKYKQALAYYKEYINYYKKVFDAKQFATIQRLEAKYQAEKKDKAIQLLQQRSAFQKKKNILYAGIAITAIIGLIGLFVAYKYRLRLALQREKLNNEKSFRLLAEQRLIKNEKEQMQKKILAGALQVEHKNELLQNLKKSLLEKSDSQSAKRQLEKIINEEMRVDNDFENIRSEFKDLHPEFFNRLQEKAEKKLTELDLKYCAYFFMKLPTKQIANLLSVEAKSVRMARYRIKQKLGLSKEDDLHGFLCGKGTA